MRLLAAWKESLDMLRPHNLKLFMLVTLNTFVQGCKVFVRSVIWWLIPLVVVYNRYFLPFFDKWTGTLEVSIDKAIQKFVWLESYLDQIQVCSFLVIDFVTWGLLLGAALYLWCLAIHPSVTRKNRGYFFSLYALSGFLVYLIIYCAPYFSIAFYLRSFVGSYFDGCSSVFNCFFLPLLLSMFGIYPFLVLFFSLDSDGVFARLRYSIVQAAKMLVYNLPAFIVITMSFLGAGYVCLYLSQLVIIKAVKLFISLKVPGMGVRAVLILGRGLGIFIPLLVFFLLISAINTMYIKKLHDNKNLYL